MQVRLEHGIRQRGRSLRFCNWGAVVAKDSRIDSTLETHGSHIRVCADPVVVDGLVRGEDKGIPLANEDLNRVDGVGLMIHPIDFDDVLIL